MPGTNPPARPSAVSPRTEDISFPCLDSLRPHSYTFLRSKTEKMLQEIVQVGRDALHRRSTASLISAVEWNAVERPRTDPDAPPSLTGYKSLSIFDGNSGR